MSLIFRHIDDPNDPCLDDIRHLNSITQRPDLPSGRAMVIAEGAFVGARMLCSRFRVHAFFGVADRFDQLRTEVAAAGYDRDFAIDENIPAYVLSPELLDEVIGFRFARGLLAVSRRPNILSVSEVVTGARTIAIMEGVNDPENIGAIFRNAAAFGVDGVLFGAATGDPLTRRSVRVSMGHVLRIPFAHLPGKRTTWQRSLDQLHRAGFTTVAMTPSGQVPLRETADAPKIAFVIGAEGPGLTEHAMRACTVRARIPMAAGSDSINVATAAATAFYERARQQEIPLIGGTGD